MVTHDVSEVCNEPWKCMVRSKITSWDEKYWYAEHCFEVDKQVRAIAIVRGGFVKKRNLVSMQDVVSLTQADPLSPPPSKIMTQWKVPLKVKKEECSSTTRTINVIEARDVSRAVFHPCLVFHMYGLIFLLSNP